MRISQAFESAGAVEPGDASEALGIVIHRLALLCLQGDVGFYRFASNDVSGTAAGTTQSEALLVAEEVVGLAAHDGCEHAEHALLVAAALPAVAALFEEAELIGLIEHSNGG